LEDGVSGFNSEFLTIPVGLLDLEPFPEEFDGGAVEAAVDSIESTQPGSRLTLV